MMESERFFSSISFKLKNETGNLVSFNDQSITLPLSIKKIKCFVQWMPETLINHEYYLLKVKKYINLNWIEINQQYFQAYNHSSKNYYQEGVL